MSTINEKLLWQLFIEGEINAFSSLFKTYYSELHNYGIKITSDQMITEDCLQSFFVYLYNSRENLGTINNVKSYLFISFRRALLKFIKKERRYTSYDQIFETNEIFGFSTVELAIDQEVVKLKNETLASLLNALSVRQREVIYLKYYSNLTTNEISEVMDISYQSVLNLLQKAFTKLRSKVEDQKISAIFKIN
ncbi:RNA polymerase sigma factor [Maribacter sp. CXY002]|uniref:RNA polymerase sigma factor n=1 Tax=Maribacter luteocoastalis TaxID=3407671 RepID=UPI003B66F984